VVSAADTRSQADLPGPLLEGSSKNTPVLFVDHGIPRGPLRLAR
jgi:hypothetical protein